jgi:DnaJ-class molecular chaperone
MALDDKASRDAIRAWIDQQHQELNQKSYYQLLGVERAADERAVRTAYYHMVARFHPDLYGDILEVDVRAKLVTLYTRLVEGYRILRDPQKRAQYNRMVDQKKLRWSLEDDRGQRREETEIANAHARRFFRLGRSALLAGDAKAAAMNLRLALSVEPGSEVIQAELARAETMMKGGK